MLFRSGLTVNPDQYNHIRKSTTGPAAWTALRNVHEKNTRGTIIPPVLQQCPPFELCPLPPSFSLSSKSTITNVMVFAMLAPKMKRICAVLMKGAIFGVLGVCFRYPWVLLQNLIVRSKPPLSGIPPAIGCAIYVSIHHAEYYRILQSLSLPAFCRILLSAENECKRPCCTHNIPLLRIVKPCIASDKDPCSSSYVLLYVW